MIKSEQNGPSPDVVIKELKKIINRKRPAIRRVVGWQYKLIAFLNVSTRKVCRIVVSKLY